DECPQTLAAMACVIDQRLTQDRLTQRGLCRRSIDSSARGERGNCGIDRGRELVRVITYRVEVRERLKDEWPARFTTRSPDDASGVFQVLPCLANVLAAPCARLFRPSVAESGEIVVRIEHDARHTLQCAFFHQAPDEHRLAGP